ncbi:MAG: hypothetical protein ACO3SJ_11760, partial [Phycisphaerales bacterium]
MAAIPLQIEQLETELEAASAEAKGLDEAIAGAKDGPIEAIQQKLDDLRVQLTSARSLLAQTRIGQLRRIEESSRLAESSDAARGAYLAAGA